LSYDVNYVIMSFTRKKVSKNFFFPGRNFVYSVHQTLNQRKPKKIKKFKT